MAIVASIPKQAYAVGPLSFSPTVPANVREVQATLTKVAWPAGQVLTIEVVYPNGVSAGVVGFDGGPALARDGTATARIGIRGVRGGFLTQGAYTVRVQVLQPITTAVTIEAT